MRISAGVSLRISAIRLKSGRERAFIFRIKLVRCTLTVDSAMPISWAICLFSRPEATCIMISRSRELSVSKRSRGGDQGPITLPAGAIPRKAGLDGLDEVLITKWFREELQGAALHRLDSHRNVGVRCNENDRQLSVRRGKVALKLETASPRHSHVEHKATRAARRVSLRKSETDENSSVCSPTDRNGAQPSRETQDHRRQSRHWE